MLPLLLQQVYASLLSFFPALQMDSIFFDVQIVKLAIHGKKLNRQEVYLAFMETQPRRN